MSDTMRCAVMPGPGAIEIRQMPVPEPSDNQVLVKVGACAICTWEQRMFRGADKNAYPFCGGHEVAGVVVAKGCRARCDAAVGDRVAVAATTRCGSCYFCRRGLDNLCSNDIKQSFPGELWGPGGFGEYIVVEDYGVYRAASCASRQPSLFDTAPASGTAWDKPQPQVGVAAPAQTETDLAELALSEPVACVVRSVGKAGLFPGDTALVQGAGIMGLLHLLLLQRQAVRVLVAEPDQARRQRALELGAAAACDPLQVDVASFTRGQTNGQGAEAVFFTAGGPAAVEQAVGALVKGGHLILYGSIHPKDPITIDPNKIHYDELTVTGLFTHTRRSFQQAVNLICSGLLDVRPFISERVPFPDVARAFERAASPDTYRVVVTFDR